MSLLEENEIIIFFVTLNIMKLKNVYLLITLEYIIVYKLPMHKTYSYDCG
jgi:hypothetical protein